MYTSTDYINNNDFEGAYSRYCRANSYWRPHWYETCEQIAKYAIDVAKNYIFDPIAKTITKIGKAIKRAGRPSKNVEDSSYVYLIRMFSNGEEVFTKVGKANDIGARMNQLKKYKYKRENIQIDCIELVRCWSLPNSKFAESFESFVHGLMSREETLIPQDRYKPIAEMDRVAALIDRQYENYTALLV